MFRSEDAPKVHIFEWTREQRIDHLISSLSGVHFDYISSKVWLDQLDHAYPFATDRQRWQIDQLRRNLYELRNEHIAREREERRKLREDGVPVIWPSGRRGYVNLSTFMRFLREGRI